MNWFLKTECEEPTNKSITCYLLACLTLLFLLSALNMHGFSFSRWHKYLDGSPPTEVLLGKPQEVRSDDWLLDLPLALAQQETGFPIWNSQIGLGQNMLFPIKTPAWHPILAFRPAVWGFVIGKDFGIAWNWWVLIFGLFSSSLLLFHLISRGRRELSILAALALTVSPYWQLWSYHKAEVAFSLLLATYGLLRIYFSKTTKDSAIACFLLFYFGLSTVLSHPYPPMMVTCGWACLAISIGLLWDRRTEIPRFRSKTVLAFAILLLTSGTLYFLLAPLSETIQLIANTVYPGKRFSRGGGLNPILLFGTHYFSLGKLSANVGNVCEAAGFFFFFPALLTALFTQKKKKGFPLFIGLSLALLMIYSFFGLPEILARITLLGKSTANRTMASWGILESSLVVYFLSNYSLTPEKRAFKRSLLVYVLCIATSGILLRHTPEGLPTWSILVITFGHALLMNYLLEGKRLFLVILILLEIAYVGIFNPVTMGGTKFIETHPLTLAIKKSDTPGIWVVYGSQTADPDRTKALTNYLPMLGVHSLGGYHTHPQFALWEKIDPDGKFNNLYNMCGRVTFESPHTEKSLEFSHEPGQLIARLSLDHPAWNKIGVTRFLAVGPDYSAFEKNPSFKLLESLSDTRIYARD